MIARLVSKKKFQQGFSLIEVLVAMVILSVVGLAVANNTIKSYSFMKRSIRNSLATQLALDKLEMVSAVNPTTLDSSDNTVETSVISKNISFTRTTTITVNSDNSRTVTVEVNGNTESLGGRAIYTNRLSLWGNS